MALVAASLIVLYPGSWLALKRFGRWFRSIHGAAASHAATGERPIGKVVLSSARLVFSLLVSWVIWAAVISGVLVASELTATLSETEPQYSSNVRYNRRLCLS